MSGKTQKLRDKCCQKCGSTDIEFNSEYGFYKCKSCHAVWSYDADDPDYDEIKTDGVNFENSELNAEKTLE